MKPNDQPMLELDPHVDLHAPTGVLLNALGLPASIIDNRSKEHPAFKSVLVEKNGDFSIIVASQPGIELSVLTQDIRGQAQPFLLPASETMKILKTMPADQTVTIRNEDGRIGLRLDSTHCRFSLMDPNELPRYEHGMFNMTLSIPTETLFRGLSRTTYAMAHQDVRSCLNGIYLEGSNNTLSFIATDGHRLASWSTKSENIPHFGAILPDHSARILRKILPDLSGNVEISVNASSAAFRFQHIRLVSSLIDGKYIDYRKLLNEKPVSVFHVPLKPLREALVRIVAVLKAEEGGIAMCFSPGHLHLQSTPSASGHTIEEDIECDCDESPLPFHISPFYLLDALKTFSGDMANLYVGDAKTPLYLGDPSQPGLTSLITLKRN